MKDSTKQALQKLADGYDFEEREVIANKSGKPEKVKIFKKHNPPDIRAIQMIEQLKMAGKW